MLIASVPPKVGFQPAQKTPDPSPPPPQPPSLTQRIVEATVDRTLASTDRIVGTLAGMSSSTAAYVTQFPELALDTARSTLNLVQSEVIGPNIKIISGLASPLLVAGAVVGAGIGLAIQAVAGAVVGFQAHDPEKPREFTIGKAVDAAWAGTRQSVGTFSRSMLESSQELKERKLAEGEDPWDIPLPPFTRTTKTLVATGAGLAMGGLGSIPTALATTASVGWQGAHKAFTTLGTTDSLAGLASLAASPVTGVVHGVSKIFTTPVAAAAVAWKQKSLSGALQAAQRECFDSKPDPISIAAGATVGGALTAVPSAAGSLVSTTWQNLTAGLQTATTDPELGPAGKSLASLGSLVTAPVSGLVHAGASMLVTPVSSLISGCEQESLVGGIAEGTKKGRTMTKALGHRMGLFAGGLAIGGVTAVSAVAAGLTSEVGGGLIEAATHPELNPRGRILAALGGVPGDVITVLGQGAGTFLVCPLLAAGQDSPDTGLKIASQYGSRAVTAAARPSTMMD